MNALLALLAEDYTDDKGLDFIEIILIGSVVVGREATRSQRRAPRFSAIF
jgi:hypothetical protein